MPWHYTPYLIPLVVAGIICLMIGSLAWSSRGRAGTAWFAVLMTAVSVWSLGYALELSSSSVVMGIFWAKVQYLGIVVVPIAWFAFVLRYTGRAARKVALVGAALAPVSLTTLVLAWTNESHRLLWSGIAPVTAAGFEYLIFSHGPAFSVHIAFTYALMAAGSALLIRALVRSQRLYRKQAFALLLAACLPWAGNVAYLSPVNPFPGLDLTPFAFTLSGLVMVRGVLRLHMLRITPIARALVVDRLSEAVIVLDRHGRVVDMNPPAVALAGGRGGVPFGKDIAAVFAAWPDLARFAADPPAGTRVELTETGPHRRSYELQHLAMTDYRNQAEGAVLVLTDITERKRIEQKLQRQLNEVQLLNRTIVAATSALDQASVLTNICTELCRTLDASFGVAGLLNEAGDELVVVAEQHGQAEPSLHLSFKIDASPELERMLAERRALTIHCDQPRLTQASPCAVMNERGLATLLMVPLLTRDATMAYETPARSAIGALLIGSHAGREFTAVQIALAEHVAAAASQAIENARLYSALQQELLERYRVESALAEAKDAAESANRAKSVFLASMSHELRTPLTAVLGYSDLLKLQVPPEAEHLISDVEQIQRAGQHLLTLIGDILDLSKIEADKMTLRLSAFDVRVLIDEVTGTVRPLALQQRNRFTVQCPPDIGAMFTDMTRLRQILLNLLGNATKFTTDGVVSLEVSREDGPDGEWVAFRICDTGIGMTPDQIQQLFQPFTQVHQTAKRSFGGAGLGLALSLRLARLMGGTIDVVSQPEVGSTFSVRLPAAVSRLGAALSGVGAPAAEVGTPSS